MSQTNQAGKPLLPAGSPRDVFLHIKPEKLLAAKSLVSKTLAGVAEVFETTELIDRGIFGPKIEDAFLKNVGNLVVLPHRDQSVFWLGPEQHFKQKLRGYHGGLTLEEMEIILFSAQI